MLGNLPAGTEAELKMSYVLELSQNKDGKVYFTLPTVLNPRYSPGECFLCTMVVPATNWGAVFH